MLYFRIADVMNSKIGSYLLVTLWLAWLVVMAFPSGSILHAQDETGDDRSEFAEIGISVTSDSAFDFSDAVQTSVVDGIPWMENIVASHYGASIGHCYGGYGNKLYPGTDYFVALPSNTDNLNYLGGLLGCRMSRCGAAQPTLDELLHPSPPEPDAPGEDFSFWMGDEPPVIDGWVIEGYEGEGLFRVLEIKLAGNDGPILEAYVGDVGPWSVNDPYWEDYSRPDAEDGVDSRGRRTNGAGIDLSYALAQALGFTGMAEIDWRWKTVNGKYVVRRQPTDWRW